MSGRRQLAEGLAEHLDHFQQKLLQDALVEATAAYWHRRAFMFERALPGGYQYPATVRRHGLDCMPGCTRCPVVHERGERKVDYPGRTTHAQQNERIQRLAATALACRQRAEVAQLTGEGIARVEDVLRAIQEAS